MLKAFQEMPFDESYKPTIGAEFANRIIDVNGTKVQIQLWDTVIVI